MFTSNLDKLFSSRLIALNIKNLKLCTLLAITVQCFLIGRNIYYYGFSFHYYIQLYIAMLISSILAYFFISQVEKIQASKRRMQLANCVIIPYYFFTLLWGVCITLLDQQSSGQVTALLINILITSSLLISNLRTFISLHILPIIVLIYGFSAHSLETKILSAYTINIGVFYIFAAIASQSIYKYIRKSIEQEISLDEQNKLLEQLNNELTQLANKDALTNLPNRYCLQQFLQDELQTPQAVTIFMLDIDSFKLYNDYYGHLQGDEVLVKVASILETIAVKNQLFATRLGGEEFALVDFQLSEHEAQTLAETICQNVEAAQIPHEKSHTSSVITVSVGYVQLENLTFSHFKQALELADKALYAAKHNGRNQAQIYAAHLPSNSH